MSIGIDKIGFATSQYVLNMANLALARGAEPEKFSKGLMLDATSITPITEDIVTLASDAAADILSDEDKKAIDMVIVATESSIDQSKAAAVYVHSLLNIQPFARSFEMKEACYAATAGLNYAKLHVAAHPDSKVLVIASDIARYGVGSSGESTQGAGAVAMLVSQDPRILELADDNVAQTRDVMDFWRPNYSSTPYVQGIYSTKQYLDSLKTTWSAYQERHQADFTDFAAFCLHLPSKLLLPIVVKSGISIQGHFILDFFPCLNSRKTLNLETRLASSLMVLELSLKFSQDIWLKATRTCFIPIVWIPLLNVKS